METIEQINYSQWYHYPFILIAISRSFKIALAYIAVPTYK